MSAKARERVAAWLRVGIVKRINDNAERLLAVVMQPKAYEDDLPKHLAANLERDEALLDGGVDFEKLVDEAMRRAGR